MNSRERRRSLDTFEVLIRDGLLERVADKLPAPEVRLRLLRRAERQQRRFSWQLPSAFRAQMVESAPRPTYPAFPNNRFHFEALFAGRLGWFALNQLMR